LHQDCDSALHSVEQSPGLPVITIDGAQMSGSGTIVRHAVALAALLGRPVRIINARQRRREPGLRQQHVMSVHACAALCGATVDGVHVGSHAFDCAPGSHIAGGSFEWDIGTAGSATMLALSVLPVAYFAAAPVRARITGGLFQDFASSPFHMQRVLAPRLRSMGADVSLEMKRPGYAPGRHHRAERVPEPSGAQRVAPERAWWRVCGERHRLVQPPERATCERADGISLRRADSRRRNVVRH